MTGRFIFVSAESYNSKDGQKVFAVTLMDDKGHTEKYFGYPYQVDATFGDTILAQFEVRHYRDGVQLKLMALRKEEK